MAQKKKKITKRRPRNVQPPVWHFAVYFILVVITLAVYAQVRDHDFVSFDDPFYVIDNPNVKADFSLNSVIWAFTTGHFFNWHPLTWLSYMLDYQMFGLKAGGYHVVNLVFHVLNSLLLFEVLRRMANGGSMFGLQPPASSLQPHAALWPSAFVAILFAIHPLHVESVAWIAERKDVLSTFFWLSTMVAYTAYVRGPSRARYILVAVLFALGLMAKPMLVTLPFVLLLMDFWPLKRFRLNNRAPNLGSPSTSSASSSTGLQSPAASLPRLLVEKLPLFALSILASGITLFVQRVGGSVMSLETFPLSVRVTNAAVAYVGYIEKMFWPAGLMVFYPHPGRHLAWWQFGGALVLLLVISGAALWWRRRRPYFIVGWLWYLGTLVPVIGLIQVGRQGMADRYTYIPLIGLFIALAWGLQEAIKAWRIPRAAVAAAATVVIAALTFLAHTQASYWQDSVVLYNHAIDVTPNNALAHHNLGEILVRENRLDEAMEHFAKTLEIDPNYPGTHTNLANLYAMDGMPDKAMPLYKRALVLNSEDKDAHYNIGIELARQNRVDEAIKHYREALRLAPDFVFAHNNLAIQLERIKRYDEALEHYHEALRIDPASETAIRNLKRLLQELNRTE